MGALCRRLYRRRFIKTFIRWKNITTEYDAFFVYFHAVFIQNEINLFLIKRMLYCGTNYMVLWNYANKGVNDTTDNIPVLGQE